MISHGNGCEIAGRLDLLEHALRSLAGLLFGLDANEGLAREILALIKRREARGLARDEFDEIRLGTLGQRPHFAVLELERLGAELRIIFRAANRLASGKERSFDGGQTALPGDLVDRVAGQG